MRQATVNLFADMGVQPATLPAGLTAASRVDRQHGADRDDHQLPRDGGRRHRRSRSPAPRPTRAAASSPASSSRPTAARPGIPATGTTSWSYTWIAHGNPSATIKVRAVDDSGNLGNGQRRHHRQRDLPVLALGPEHDGAGRRPRLRRSDAGRGRRQVQGRQVRHGLRPPLLQGGDEHRHARRHAVVGVRRAARAGHVHQRDGVRLADRHASAPPSRCSRTRPTSRPTTRPTGTTRPAPTYFYNAPAPGPNGGAIVDSPPLHAVAQHAAHATNGVYRYGATSTFPTSSFGGVQLLGRRDLHADGRCPAP